MTVATSPPPAGWYVDPDGSGGQRYWDGERWTTQRRRDPSSPRSALTALADRVRRLWSQTPVVLRLALPIALVLILAGALFYAWSRPQDEDDWSRLPSRLSCQLQSGPKPPPTITVASVAVSHPRDDVLALMVRFAGPLPPPPTGAAATGFVGFKLTYSLALNGKTFVELGPQDGTDDLAIRSVAAGNTAEANLRADRNTHARRTAADTEEIYLELTRLKVDHQLIVPELTVAAQFNTPSIVTVRYATQVCR
jgi:hypothetical protein